MPHLSSLDQPVPGQNIAGAAVPADIVAPARVEPGQTKKKKKKKRRGLGLGQARQATIATLRRFASNQRSGVSQSKAGGVNQPRRFVPPSRRPPVGTRSRLRQFALDRGGQ